ncbi:MAG TPA: hypothetical protein VH054_02705, partial [Polyangiaceae bacterium]|nr:hypothetical protein [Polyangiaceae bacterium]
YFAAIVCLGAFPLLVSAAALAQTGHTSTTGKDGGAATTMSSAKPATSGSVATATTAMASSAPTSSVAGPTTAPTGSGAMDGATYNVRLRDLEARVDELKDQIRRSHTRLALLSDTILSGGAAGSRSEINYHNEMSSAFRLVRALFVLDGAVQYNRQDDTGALADQKDIPIYSGSITPGDHTMSALLTFQGNGYGVFTYLRGYKFEVKSSHSFTAVEGKTLSVTATSFEGGGVTTPLQDRPKIEWKEKVQALGPGGGSGGNSQPVAGGDKK